MSAARRSRNQGGANVVFLALVGVATLLFIATIHVVFMRAPVEKTMGIVQKIFYFHVPSAYSMYIGAFACFLGSAAYLIRPTDGRDALARAGAELAVVFGAIVLTTGPLWAAKAWGYYWTWDPRLTTSLLSVLIYVAYLVLRAFTGDGEGERRFAAALGILGAANLPIIHFSVQKWSGQHPAVITGKGGGLADPNMKLALMLSFLAFTLFAIALLWARVRLEVAKNRLARCEEDAIDLGLDDRDDADAEPYAHTSNAASSSASSSESSEKPAARTEA
ncbi:cytochrome c biogenesis protein [Pendulispora albinea]|uniref:Heme exporter protein C n=1 Tax=Pendulispora albinea TaxID=2741071 RepID=A0ABZ2M552_9BACT